MDRMKFSSAQSLYDAGEYDRAREMFAALLQDTAALEPGDTGHILHMVGNCLTKQRRFEEAAVVYRRALEDPAYLKRGSLDVNLGLALSAQKRYQEAIGCFEAALADKTYETPYKAYAALGNAQLKMGNAVDAGTNYRRAALENNNPDPARPLVNLGVCFMALNRPSDAVESYITALEFEADGPSRCKTYANLGQAYVATGRMSEAVDAFEAALADGTYHLSDAAFVDYQRARSTVEAEEAADAGLDRFEDPYAAASEPTGSFAATGTMGYQPAPAGYYPEDYSTIPPADDTGFFSLTDEEIDRQGRSLERDQRRARNIGPKIFLVLAIILLLLVIAAGALYFKGYGYPLQETVVTEMFSAYDVGGDYQRYWANADTADIDSAMTSVAKTSDVSVDAVQRDMTGSTAQVTATLPEGGEVHYVVTLGRDGLGWKIMDIQLVFQSQS